MLRQRENAVSLKAGALSVIVHVVLLIALLISFNWKAAHPVSLITEVELWDSLPVSSQLLTPEPIIKPEPVLKQEPKPVVETSPPEEVKVDIALERKLKEVEQKKSEEKVAAKLKKEQELEQKKKLAAIQEDARKEELRDSEKALKESKLNNQKNALKKLQQEALADEKTAGDQQALSSKAAMNAGTLDVFRNKIQAKIRGNVNKSLCGDGNPELKFDIGLLLTGELSTSPKLIKSSGNIACDEAVERAIIASQPLPLPSDASLFSQFRNLRLIFRPNDGN